MTPRTGQIATQTLPAAECGSTDVSAPTAPQTGNTEDTCHGCAAHICDACRAALEAEVQAATAKNREADDLCSPDQFAAYEQRVIAEAVGRLPDHWTLERSDKWYSLRIGEPGPYREPHWFKHPDNPGEEVSSFRDLPDLARAVLERFGREEEAK